MRQVADRKKGETRDSRCTSSALRLRKEEKYRKVEHELLFHRQRRSLSSFATDHRDSSNRDLCRKNFPEN
jgi:hypothetical protein